MTTIIKIKLTELNTHEDTQARVAIDDATVNDYAEAMQAGAVFAPIVVFRDDDMTMRVADGFHRVRAAARTGRTEIDAEVRVGSKTDAVLHAVGANADHGLRRTSADKRRAVTLLLSDPTHQDKSNRAIADACRVSDKLVADVRAECGNSQSEKTVGKDGRARAAKRPAKAAEPDEHHEESATAPASVAPEALVEHHEEPNGAEQADEPAPDTDRDAREQSALVFKIAKTVHEEVAAAAYALTCPSAADVDQLVRRVALHLIDLARNAEETDQAAE